MLLEHYGIKRYLLNVLKMGKIKDSLKKAILGQIDLSKATRKAAVIVSHKGNKPKTVIKAAVKPKVLEQTPTGMANSTKSSPYIPPAKVTKKPKL